MQNSYSTSTLNNFRTAVAAGDFLITAEVAPPKGGDITHTIAMAATLKGEFMLSILLTVAAL